MARNPARARRRAAKAATPKPDAPKTNRQETNRPGVLTLDPATEREINGLFLGLLKRLGITVIIMMLSSIGIVTLAKVTRNVAVGVFFLSVLIGLLISFWRNVEKAFLGVKQLGMQRLQQHRYADAAFTLEHFHRLGNMSFDKDGEAHYSLALAYLGLKQPDRAAAMVDWLRRHRARAPYTERAAAALAAARNSSSD